MKKVILSVLFIAGSLLGNAQSKWCATDEMLEESFKNDPAGKAAFMQEAANLMASAPVKGGQNSKAPTIIVPVVVHVIHYNGAGNITKQQIDDGIRILNEDFQKLNSDTSAVRSVFQPYIADAQMEFRLAKIDPDGNCTEGVNRINSFLTYNKRNEVKALSYWDANKYLNVWLVNTIRPGSSTSGTTLGYAQFPNSSNLATYGLVVRHDEWGSIGTSSSNDGRTVTHEVGHCFGLFHTFQGSCGTFCNNTGDFVCDTPPQFDDNNNSCNFSLNTCSNDATGGTSLNPNPYTTNVPDQLENYMGYGLSCLGMFTEGQKDRMQAAFNVYSHLNSLRSASNLFATGTNNGYVASTCPPKAEIIDTQKKLVCQGGTVTFSEDSYGAPVTSYNWSFPGATPSTSSSATPTVTYNTPGIHSVTLVVSNSSGSDTLIVPNYIVVDDTSSSINGFNYNESFENSAAVAQYISISPSGNAEFLRTTAASFTGNASMFLDNYNNNSNNEIDYLISPSIDLTQVINPTFKFRLAYKTQTGANDVLKCAMSIDCGNTWITRLFLNSGNMSSGTLNGSTFVPNSASDWKDFTVTTTPAIRASKNVIFRFDWNSGGGNNVFIDDFRVDGQSVVGINDLSNETKIFNVYPNPSFDENTTLEFQLSKVADNGQVYLTDILGKRVLDIYNGRLTTDDYKFNIQTSQLESGIYFLSIQTENDRQVRKLIVR